MSGIYFLQAARRFAPWGRTPGMGTIIPIHFLCFHLVNTYAMKWLKLHNEATDQEGGESKSIPVEVSTREIKLIQNYLNKGKPLNDPSNKDALETVIRILNDIVNNSDIENLETYVSNFFFDNLGIEVELDPYGENSAIELSENGMIHLSHCEWVDLCDEGKYADLVQGGFWDDFSGELEEGFISVEDLNKVLAEMKVGNGVKSIQLKEEGDVAKLMLNFN